MHLGEPLESPPLSPAQRAAVSGGVKVAVLTECDKRSQRCLVNHPTLAKEPLAVLSFGWIVLVQFASLGEGENDGRFTVKKYHGGGTSHRRRLAALFNSAPTAESGVRADHARAGGRRRTVFS